MKRALLLVAGIAMVVTTAGLALAQDDQAVLLRYKWEKGEHLDWDMTMHVTGRFGIVEGPQAGTSLDLDNTMAMTIFADVVEVLDDGSAWVKMTLGEMNIESTLPNGQTVNIALDLASGKVRILAPGGNQPVEQDLPKEVSEIFGQGFTMRITDRGEVKELKGAEKLKAMLERMGGPQASAIDITQTMNWIEPYLPEKPVKPGDTWEQEKPNIFGMPGAAGAQGNKPFIIRFKHAGYSVVDGVRCVKIETTFEASGVDMSVATAQTAATGLHQQLKGMSMRMSMVNLFSLEDHHVQSVKGTIHESGTVHQEGTIEINGREVQLNQTFQLDDVTVEIEAQRAKED
ncbi:MAG: hypothetical protein J7M26_02480 [Armatimonadetes bacterium]|nr:hypothetical protein [Armatimonadota bacterium]